MVEKRYNVLFNNDCCQIKDANDSDLFRIKMEEKNFVLNPLEEAQIAFLVTLVELHSLHVGKVEQESKIEQNTKKAKFFKEFGRTF